MKNSLSTLLIENVFDDLGIPPSSSLREIRRHLQDLRMQSSIGLSQTPLSKIEFGETSLVSDSDCMEFRLLASWGSDDRLRGCAAAHDSLVATMKSALTTPPLDAQTLGSVLRGWCRLAEEPLVVDFVRLTTSDNVSVTERVADLCASLTKSAFDVGDTLIDSGDFQSVLRGLGQDKKPLVDAIGETLTLHVANLSHAAATSSGTSAQLLQASGAEFVRSCGLAVSFLNELGTPFRPAGGSADWHEAGVSKGGEREVGEALCSRFKTAAITISTSLFNAKRFADAVSVDFAALRLPQPPAAEEELRADLAIIRLVEARENVRAALASGNLAAARVALTVILSLSPDPSERAEAQRMIAQVDGKTQGTNEGSFSGKAVGWVITAVIAIGIAVARGSASSNSTGSRSVAPPSVSTTVTGGTRSTDSAAAEKAAIERIRSDLKAADATLSAASSRLDAQRAALDATVARYPNGAPAGVLAAYQRDLSAFNAGVDAFNRAQQQYASDLVDFNRRVAAYNATYGGR